MEIITTTIYSKHDIFGCWSVKWEYRGGGSGITKVAAVIFPYWKVLFEKLASDGYINFSSVSEIVDAISNPGSYSHIRLISNMYRKFSPYESDYYSQKENEKAIVFLNAFSEFCESEKNVIEKKVYSFWDAMDIGGGNSSGFEKARRKIKKDLVLEGEDTVYNRLKVFLKTKHLI